MLRVNQNTQVYLACGATDMRKSINGLSLLVSEVLQQDVFSASLFVFCNCSRDKLKILHRDNNGFWLYYKRLEKGRFKWPELRGQTSVSLTQRELNWLPDGLNIEKVQAHPRLNYTHIGWQNYGWSIEQAQKKPNKNKVMHWFNGETLYLL